MKIRAYMTGTRVIFTNDRGDYTSEDGWLDWDFSSTTLYDEKSDVRPVAEWDSIRDPNEYTSGSAFITETVEKILGSAEESDGTFYSTDTILNRDYLENGAVWSYALHFERLSKKTGEWVPAYRDFLAAYRLGE